MKTHVQLLEDLREEVREEEMAQFDKLVEPTRQKVVTAVESFLQIDPAITITSGELASYVKNLTTYHYQMSGAIPIRMMMSSL